MRTGVIRFGGEEDMVKSRAEKEVEGLIRNRNFRPEKYGMLPCPECRGGGYITVPKRQFCPGCGGFGWIRSKDVTEQETEKDYE